MGIGAYIVPFLLLLGHVIILAERDGLVGVLLPDCRNGEEYREGLFTFQDMNKTGILSLCRVQVNCWLLRLVLLKLTLVVQVVGYLIMGHEHRHIELLLGTVQQQQEGIDSIIRPAAQISGHHKAAFLNPRFLPVLVNGLDAFHHQLCKGVKSTVFRAFGVLASPMVLFSVISHSYCCASSAFFSSNFHSEISFT